MTRTSWVLLNEEEPQKNSLPFLLLINGECLDAEEKANHKLRFGIRNAKAQVFPSLKSDDKRNLVDTAYETLERGRLLPRKRVTLKVVQIKL